MRNIAIVGAGQAGLQLAIGLLKHNYNITLFNSRSAEQIRNGRVLSSQGMFDAALFHERSLGLNFWDDDAPKNDSVSFKIIDPVSKQAEISWCGQIKKAYQSVDQRLKFSKWLEVFETLGGHLKIRNVTENDLVHISHSHDLTIVATGKGALSNIFEIDHERTQFSEPQRELCCLYVNNIAPDHSSLGVHVNIIPGIGEFFIMPGLTFSGHCEIILFEGVKGQSFAQWPITNDGQKLLEHALHLMKKYVPHEYERCKHGQLTDEKAILRGRYTPVIRRPVRRFEDAPVLGIADAVVLNDPIAGQGANNASKAANLYLHRILAHNRAEFTDGWMQSVFEEYWDTIAQWSTAWSNMQLFPPPEHVVNLLSSAAQDSRIANDLSNGFDNPHNLFPWILSPEHTQAHINAISM